MIYGIYEKLVRKNNLDEINEDILNETRVVDNSEIAKVASISYENIIRNKLSKIDKLEDKIEFIDKLNDAIGIQRTENTIFKELLTVHREKNEFERLKESRPKTSIANSTLFTGHSGPTLESELIREIRTADEILFLVSFIKFSGLRLIYDDLVEFTKTKKLKVITTSYMGASDYKAILKLSKLPNTEVKISYDVKRTRLHAKAYYFGRNTGFSTAYIGSSNISNPALSNGLEWNLKVSEYTSKDVMDSFIQNFETYWNDDEFIIFNPEDESHKIELRNSLESKVNDEKDYIFFDLKPYSHQKEILEDLDLERKVYKSNKNLVVAATGTGKTFMAFQIIYRLWKAGIKKKILFLADRNVLIDQTISGDFKPFAGKMTKIEKKTLDPSYEIYLGLYHQLSGDDGQESFRQLKPNFFDLIVIDECHRGSAKEDSEWRKILDYFSSATHLGLTATPVETKEASNQSYFGQPIYEYSLKQGIDDGFLAPYKVIRIGLDKDLEGYRPEEGKVDRYGYEIDDREYNVKDYDRTLVIDDRTKVIAKKISEYLRKTDRFSKTIVFCVDIEHAERMRQALINENKDLYREDHRYIMRITGDNDEGKAQLEYFIDEESTYPVIAVTSKLMTTGVDAKMCKLIVLENNINSMTEFKQIIGRGTRLLEEYGKTYFTIMDFRNSSRLFADPAFDGQPEVVIDLDGDDPVEDPPVYEDDNGLYGGEEEMPPFINDGGDDPGYTGDFDDEFKPKKYYIDDVEVRVLSERVQYVDRDGKLITESLTDYTKKNIRKQFANLDEFLNTWTQAEKKQAIVEELEKEGVLLDAIREEIGMNDIDDFDLICHLAYDKAPLTKRERAENVKKRHYLYKYSGLAQEVLEALLDKYTDEGLREIEETRVLELEDFRRFGSPLKIVKAFGGREAYRKAVQELGNEIFYA